MIDFASRAVGLILSPYKGLKLYIAIVQSVGEEIQEVYTFYTEILDFTSISTAVFTQLDKLGDKYGEPRLGRADEIYRAAIHARVAFILSTTTPEEVYSTSRGFFGTDADLTYLEDFDAPSTFIIRYSNVPDDYSVEIATMYANDITSIDPAGTRGIVQFEWENEPFGFEGNPNALGFGEGKFSGAFD